MILGFRAATAGVVAFLLVLACTIGFAWTAYADPAEDGQEVASQAVDAAVPAGESAQAAELQRPDADDDSGTAPSVSSEPDGEEAPSNPEPVDGAASGDPTPDGADEPEDEAPGGSADSTAVIGAEDEQSTPAVPAVGGEEASEVESPTSTEAVSAQPEDGDAESAAAPADQPDASVTPAAKPQVDKVESPKTSATASKADNSGKQASQTPAATSQQSAQTPKASAPAKAAKPNASAKKVVKRIAKQAASKGKGDLLAGIYYIITQLDSMRAVGVAGNSKKDGGNVQLAKLTGAKAQQWQLIIGKDGYAMLRERASGKLLTVARSEKSDGTNVLQWKAKGKDDTNQKWIVKKTGKYYRIISALDTSKVLNVRHSETAVGTNLNIWTWKERDRQLFRFVSAKPAKKVEPGSQVLANGIYTIQALSAHKHSLDIAGHSTAKGASLRVKSASDAAGQAFSVAYDGKGFYSITNVRSGKKLAVSAACPISGIDVGQFAMGDKNSRAKWKIVASGKGYQIVNKATGLTLDVAADDDADAGNVRGWGAKTRTSQQFTFKKQPAFAAGVASFELVASKNLVLSIVEASAEKGAKAGTAKNAGSMNQRFLVAAKGKGYTIRPFNSRLYLTVAKDKTLVQDKAHKRFANQVWIPKENAGRVMLVNAETGLALTTKGSAAKATGTLKLTKAKGTDKQLLYLRPGNVVADGIYAIHLAKSSKQRLNVSKARRTSNVNVDVWEDLDRNSQRFVISALGGGRYTILSAASGRALEVANGSTADGANVQMFKATGAKHQQWKITLNDDFTLQIANAKTGTRLEIAGDKVKNGSNVQVAKAKPGATHQEFWLTETAKKAEIVKIGVPCYKQNPQLPTGCESVALTNALNYWGCKLKKTTIANYWMPRGSNGVYNFIGNPHDESGWIICAPGITNTANKYLKKKGKSIRAKNVTGTSLKDLRKYIDNGCPVVVWTTIGMGAPGPTTWRSGYPLRNNNHAVVITGYNPKNGAVQVADSLAGTVWRSGGAFNRLYKAMGKQAVVLYD